MLLLILPAVTPVLGRECALLGCFKVVRASVSDTLADFVAFFLSPVDLVAATILGYTMRQIILRISKGSLRRLEGKYNFWHDKCLSTSAASVSTSKRKGLERPIVVRREPHALGGNLVDCLKGANCYDDGGCGETMFFVALCEEG